MQDQPRSERGRDAVRQLRTQGHGIRRGSAGEDMSALPQLLDCKALRAELGISRAAAEAIMRRLDVVVIEDLRKTYVKREDVLAYLETRTFSKDQVAA